MKFLTLSSIIILAFMVLFACGNGPTKSEDGIALISSKDLATVLEKNPTIQLVDVRTPVEYEGGTIAHAVNIDFHADDFEAQITKLDKTKDLYVFCAKGGRSAAGAKKCKKLGFKMTYDLDGGYTAWSQMQK